MKYIYVICCLFLITIKVSAQDLSGVTILVNPGHGGFDSDDRNITIAPFASGDPKGFWESQSNFDKGIQLRDLLERAGAKVVMSRLSNKPTTYQLDENGQIVKDKDGDPIITYTDDTPLTQIVRMANEANADYMLSIHSNAGVTNYILQLYAGVDLDDTYTYPTPTPCSDESREISTIIAKNLYTNQVNTWASGTTVRGDKTFGRTAMKWSDGYGVLRGLKVPGCISEGSMHDYIPETYRLMNMEYKWLEAWHFYKSFCEYFKAGEITSGNIAGTVHDSRNLNPGNYLKIKNSKDELLPLHKAKITVNPGGLVYTTDELYNGVFVFKELTPGIYTVTAEAEGYTSHTETLEVKKNETTYFNFMLNMIRNTPPEVINYSPVAELTEPVKCATPIVFEFNWDVDVESAKKAFSILPETEGTISFEDSQHRMIFTPDQPYQVSTVYTVKLGKSLQHPAGLSMLNDFSFQFMTDNRNLLKFLACYPTPGVEYVNYGKNAPFEFRFDNRLNSAMVRDAVKIYNSKGEELSKVPRSIKVNSVSAPYGSLAFTLSEGLTENETYRVVVDRNMIDVDGIDIVEPMDYTFKAVDVKVTDRTVGLDMETAGTFTYFADGSTGITSASTSRNTSKVLFGSSSGAFTYNFAVDTADGIACYQTTSGFQVDATKAIGMHVLGDLTGNEVWLQLSSSDGDVQEIKLADLTFCDWAFVEVSLGTLPAKKTYELTGLKIKQKAQPLTKTGTIYVDNVLVYDNTLTSIEAEIVSGFSFRYIAGTNEIVASSDKVVSMELYSLSGELLSKVASSRMDVGGLTKGIYVIKANLESGSSVSQKIVLRD
ncbi:Ig-like domain-containing protein [Bacteroides sp. HPS0048]|uniref:Ig-like domain-containing protein n=1 Tax=Bacteroides sp. HPS0048 TaxID=1078089 RepID=UPI003561BE35